MRLQNLGYATTIHTAQGLTADTSHTLLAGDESRQQLYTAITRGCSQNHLHCATPSGGVLVAAPGTAAELLVEIARRDERLHSAHAVLATGTTQREAHPSPVLAPTASRPLRSFAQ